MLTGTITGTYTELDGSTARPGGYVIIPSAPVVLDPDGNKVLSGAITGSLDSNGAFSETVPSSADGTLDPSGVTYTVIVTLDGDQPQKTTGVYVGSGATVNMDTETSVDPAPLSYVPADDTTIASRVNDPSSATTAALAAGYEPLTVGGKRAVREDELVFNVKDYGAVGNGVTNDATAINSATTAARAVPGGRVLLPPGTYLISSVVLAHGVTIVGYGATLKMNAGAVFNMVRMNDTTGCAIQGLTFDGNSANTTDSGNDAVGVGVIANPASWSTPVVIRDCAFSNFHRAAVYIAPTSSVTDPASAPASATVVDNCTMAATRYGVYANRVTDLTVTGCRITTANQVGVFANLCNRPVINGNHISGSATQHGIATLYCLAQRVTENSCLSNTQHGIAIGGGSTTNVESRYAVVANNVCQSNGMSGITLDTTKTGATSTPVPLYATVVGNVCNANANHGIYVNNSSVISLNGNTCRSNTQDGIALSTADTAISGNLCTGNTVRGISVYGNASFPNYGRHRIGVNYVAGNAAGYFVEGASVTDVSWATLTTTNPAP